MEDSAISIDSSNLVEFDEEPVKKLQTQEVTSPRETKWKKRIKVAYEMAAKGVETNAITDTMKYLARRRYIKEVSARLYPA